jgi:hypothetical protein
MILIKGKDIQMGSAEMKELRCHLYNIKTTICWLACICIVSAIESEVRSEVIGACSLMIAQLKP